MRRLCNYLSVCVGLSRVRIDYVLNAIQNAHILTRISKSDCESNADFVEHCLQFAGASDAARDEITKAIPDFDKALATHVASDWTKDAAWLPTSSVGRYGALHVEVLSKLQATQQSASVVEATLCASLPGDELIQNTVGFATVTLEKCPEVDVRVLRVEEASAALNYIVNHVDDCLATIKDELNSCKPHFRWALEQRLDQLVNSKANSLDNAAKEQLSRSLMGISSDSELLPGRLIRKAKDESAVLHLTVVIGHAGHKGAGKAAIEKVCQLADELQLPVILEALPNDSLPTYYTRYGFVGVVLGNTNITASSMARQGFLIMWREPRPKDVDSAEGPSGAGAAASMNKSPAVQVKSAVDLLQSESKLQRYTTRRRDNKLDNLHLTPITEAYVNKACVFNAKNVLLSFATWAKEYARQVKTGQLATTFTIPDEEEIRRLEEDQASAAIPKAMSGAKRRREDDGPDAEPIVTQRVPPQPRVNPTTKSITIPVGTSGASSGMGQVILNFSNCTVNIYLKSS